MSLLDEAEKTLDAFYIQLKKAIKAQKDFITNGIERVKMIEDMDEEARKS